MSIDLKAFQEAEEGVRADIQLLRDSSYTYVRVANILQWMLVQIDALTKKVAQLEKEKRQ